MDSGKRSHSGVQTDSCVDYLLFLSVASVSCSLETYFSNWSITRVPLSSKNADTDLVNSASLKLLDFPSVKETLSVYWSSNLEDRAESGGAAEHLKSRPTQTDKSDA